MIKQCIERMTLTILIMVMTGCAGAPMRSGFLQHYESMVPRHDLDAVRFDGNVNFNDYDTLIFSGVDTKLIGPSLAHADEKGIVDALETHFRSEMSKYFKNIATETDVQGDALKLELALVDVQPTDVAKNLLVGFGAGNATATIEGRFVDAKTGEEVLAFMDRKKGSPFTKKEYNAGVKFPNWSKLRYLYLFTEIWAENAGNIVKAYKK